MHQPAARVLIASLLGLALGACVPALPACAPSSLVAPDMGPPFLGQIVAAPYALQWTYPDTSCQPEWYQVDIARDAGFADLVAGEQVSGASSTWSPPPGALAAGTRYHWRVIAGSGATFGPNFSNYFVTGPVCSPADLNAPSLISPLEGDRYDPGTQAFYMDAPMGTCTPQSMRVEVSADPAFTSLAVELTVPLPYAGFRPSWSWEECRTYYWRGQSIAADGVTGSPYSDIRSFVADSTGTCVSTPLTFTVVDPAYCRYGPGMAYGVSTSFPANTILPIVGRNPDASWFLVETADGQQCWISAATGLPSGDARQAAEAEIPPTPVQVFSQPTETPPASGGQTVICTNYSFLTCPVPPCKKVPYQNQVGGTCTYP